MYIHKFKTHPRLWYLRFIIPRNVLEQYKQRERVHPPAPFVLGRRQRWHLSVHAVLIPANLLSPRVLPHAQSRPRRSLDHVLGVSYTSCAGVVFLSVVSACWQARRERCYAAGSCTCDWVWWWGG